MEIENLLLTNITATIAVEIITGCKNYMCKIMMWNRIFAAFQNI
jgi:hypothetical protein